MITGPNRIRNIKSRDSIAALMVIHYVPGGIRTPDPRLRRALLYPAELLKQERFIIYHNYEEDASPNYSKSQSAITKAFIIALQQFQTACPIDAFVSL